MIIPRDNEQIKNQNVQQIKITDSKKSKSKNKRTYNDMISEKKKCQLI